MRSISSQTYSNLEVIVVNDGSTDSSLTMANQWAERDGRVRVIDKPNGGVSLARRDGLLQAKGEFVAFVDSDDWLPVTAIESLVALMLQHGADLVIGSTDKRLGLVTKHRVDKVYSFPYHQVVRQPELFDNYYLGFFRNNIFQVSMCARLYRKRVIEKAMAETDLFDKEVNMMGEDQFFNLKTRRSITIAIVAQPHGSTGISRNCSSLPTSDLTFSINSDMNRAISRCMPSMWPVCIVLAVS